MKPNHRWTMLMIIHLSSVVISRRDSQMYQVDENLMMIRCQNRHCRSPMDDCSSEKCLERSLNSSKEGYCAGVEPLANSVAGLCMDTCGGRDYSCPGTHKCCRHKCGRSCTPANGLDRVGDHVLPAIPQNVTVADVAQYRYTADIAWRQTYSYTSNMNLTFVVEARSHPGYHYNQHKLGQWFVMGFEMTWEQELRQTAYAARTRQWEYSAMVRLRLGRWYIFRVAAVNENGTRGYSRVTHQFQLKERPKNPRPPRKFVIDKPPRLLPNQTIYAKVTWKPQRSDYPIERYRIAWSLHLQSDNASKNQSLWLNEAYIMEPIRFFEFWDLKPNAFYYVQLQAICTFGRKPLKSPIETLFLNTSIATTYRPLVPTDTRRTESNIIVRFLSNKMCNLVVRIMCPESVECTFLELCRGGAECHRADAIGHRSRVRPNDRYFDFADLEFNQRYSVMSITYRKWDNAKAFTTPSMEQFRRKHSNCL